MLAAEEFITASSDDIKMQPRPHADPGDHVRGLVPGYSRPGLLRVIWLCQKPRESGWRFSEGLRGRNKEEVPQIAVRRRRLEYG